MTYQLVMFLLIKYFPNVICEDSIFSFMNFYPYQEQSYEDSDFCELLLSIGDRVLFVVMIITAVFGAIALLCIRKYEGELAVKKILGGDQQRLNRA